MSSNYNVKPGVATMVLNGATTIVAVVTGVIVAASLRLLQSLPLPSNGSRCLDLTRRGLDFSSYHTCVSGEGELEGDEVSDLYVLSGTQLKPPGTYRVRMKSEEIKDLSN